MTGFAGELLDGQPHTLSLSVLGNNADGYWLLDAALLLARSPALPGIVRGQLLSYFDSGTDLSVQRRLRGGVEEEEGRAEKEKEKGRERELVFLTEGGHVLSITGLVYFSDGSSRLLTLQMAINTTNSNAFIGQTTGRTRQVTELYVEREEVDKDGHLLGRRVRRDRYPLFVEDYYAQDDVSFDMQATVLYDFDVLEQWQQPGQVTTVAWNNRMASNATYNRTLDHVTVFNQNDSARDAFRIRINSGAVGVEEEVEAEAAPVIRRHVVEMDNLRECYIRGGAAVEGAIAFDRSRGTCAFPAGISFCGYELCGDVLVTGTQAAILDPTPAGGDEDSEWDVLWGQLGEAISIRRDTTKGGKEIPRDVEVTVRGRRRVSHQ